MRGSIITHSGVPLPRPGMDQGGGRMAKHLRNATPAGRSRILSEVSKRDISQAVLRIGGEVGMHVHHDAAKIMLLEARCTLTAEERALIPRHLVAQGRRSVPSAVDVDDRDGGAVGARASVCTSPS